MAPRLTGSAPLSADARVAIVGGPQDHYFPEPDPGGRTGAAWTFTTPGTSGDSNGDCSVTVADVFY